MGPPRTHLRPTQAMTRESMLRRCRTRVMTRRPMQSLMVRWMPCLMGCSMRPRTRPPMQIIRTPCPVTALIHRHPVIALGPLVVRCAGRRGVVCLQGFPEIVLLMRTVQQVIMVNVSQVDSHFARMMSVSVMRIARPMSYVPATVLAGAETPASLLAAIRALTVALGTPVRRRLAAVATILPPSGIGVIRTLIRAPWMLTARRPVWGRGLGTARISVRSDIGSVGTVIV